MKDRSMYKTLVELLPILISIFALGFSVCFSLYAVKQSENALEESRRANKLAKKAQKDTSRQFTSLNRPLLVIKPDSFQPANNHFEITHIDGKKMTMTIPIVIRNMGNMIADNAFLHSASCRLYLGKKLISVCKKEYDTGTGGKLTFMDIPPNDGVVKMVDFIFTLSDDIDTKNLRDALIASGRMESNFLLHYYSNLDKDRPLASNISFEIAYKWYIILMLKV